MKFSDYCTVVTFNLLIFLRVVGCCGKLFYSKKMVEGCQELAYKLRFIVRQ